MGEIFDFSTGARVAAARAAAHSPPATHVVPITTDPVSIALARARARSEEMLALGGEPLLRFPISREAKIRLALAALDAHEGEFRAALGRMQRRAAERVWLRQDRSERSDG
jgi:hypothetical protein